MCPIGGKLAHDGDPHLILGRRADGAICLSCSLPLEGAEVDIAARLRHWADVAPDRLLLSAQGRYGRETLSYAEALRAARALHGSLTATGLKPGARIATLLPAGLAALTLRLACLLGNFTHISLPPHPFRGLASFPPPAGGEADRLWRVVRPELIILPSDHPLVGQGPARSLADLPHGPMLADRDGAAGDWTSIFLTAGSTGASKGVPITRGMIGSCQAAYAAIWPFLTERPPVLIDWMPWNHVFGGLDNLFKIIWNGGSLHLVAPPMSVGDDELIGLMDEVRPTLLIGVPLGLKLLLDAHDADPARVVRGCADLGAIFFAGAAMEPALWQRLHVFRTEMAVNHGRKIRLLSGYGATEAASTMCLAPGDIVAPGYLGWPLPGHELALVETEDRCELRFRGPNLAPCYLGEDGSFPLPLDEFGFYHTGDAAVLADDATGQPMLRFDGRLAEDFKLSSGIKVRAGMLRSQILRHLGPDVQDLVLGGEGRDALVAMVFSELHISGDGLEDRLAQAFAAWNRANPGSSTAISRFLLAALQPSVGAGEISAKGQLVHGRIRRNHATLFCDLSEGRIGRAPV